MNIFISNLICAVALTTSTLALADASSDFEIDAELAVGVTHNSALSVDELDDVSAQSDSGYELNGALKGKWRLSDKAQITASYGYNQIRYSEYSQYDLALHQLSADGSYKLASSEVGMRVDAARADLAGQTFLRYQQASLYAGKFIQPQTFLRASVNFKSKSFTQLFERDASGISASASLFHFSNGANTMLMAGLSVEQEKAKDIQFNHWAVGINTKVTHKFNLFGLTSRVGLGLRLQKKDYDVVEVESSQPSDSIERDENRKVVQANWQLYLLDNLSVVTEWEYGDYQSLISTQTYQQNIASVGVNYNF